MDTDEIMSARDLALLFAGGREAEKLAEAMTAWKIVHLRAERAACALVAKKEGYPEWDEDIPQRHRDSWEQCALRIMSAILSRTEGEGK